MSDTPITDAAITERRHIHKRGGSVELLELLDANVSRKLERERDHMQALVAEMKQAIVWAKAEAKERLHRLDQAACERRTWLEAHEKMKRERDEQTAQMCQAIGYLSTIAEDCEAWLNGECEEPSMDFIKAVRDYARKAING